MGDTATAWGIGSATNRDEALSHRNAKSSTMRGRKKLHDALSVRKLVMTVAFSPDAKSVGKE